MNFHMLDNGIVNLQPIFLQSFVSARDGEEHSAPHSEVNSRQCHEQADCAQRVILRCLFSPPCLTYATERVFSHTVPVRHSSVPLSVLHTPQDPPISSDDST